jgi:hypothetical protein
VLFVASYYLAPMLSTALLNMNMAAAGVVEGLAAGAAYGNALASANLVAGLATGFVGGALAGAIQGGSIKSAVIGGVFGTIAGGIGAHLGDAAVGSNRWFLRVGLHTAAGGARAQLAGGRFLSGAIGAGVTAGVGGYLHKTFGEGLGPRLGGFVAASTTGGLSAFAASGGKTSAFTSGLVSAAFEYGFNTMSSKGGTEVREPRSTNLHGPGDFLGHDETSFFDKVSAFFSGAFSLVEGTINYLKMSAMTSGFYGEEAQARAWNNLAGMRDAVGSYLTDSDVRATMNYGLSLGLQAAPQTTKWYVLGRASIGMAFSPLGVIAIVGDVHELIEDGHDAKNAILKGTLLGSGKK